MDKIKNRLLIILLILLIIKFSIIGTVFVILFLALIFPAVDGEPETNYHAGYEEVLEKPFKECNCGHRNFPDDKCTYRDLLYCKRCGTRLYKAGWENPTTEVSK